MEDWEAVRDRLRRLCELPAKDVPCQDDIRAVLEQVEARDRRIAFMEGVDEREDSGWCGDHPRMFSLRPGAEADGECLMCANEALRQRMEEYHEEALAAVTAEADALARKREVATERDALRQRVEELEQTAARIASEAACERLRAEAAEADNDALRRSLTEAADQLEAAEKRAEAAEAKLAESQEAYLEEHAKVGNRDSALVALRAEVERLEGLILAWEGYQEGCHADLLAEARRIRAQHEEGR